MAFLRSARFIEWRAASIRNPVRRLRYLRKAAGSLPISKRRRTVGRLGAGFALLAAILLSTAVLWTASPPTVEARTVVPVPRPAITESPPQVWLVESKADHEIYSSGLRVETSATVRTRPRRWIRLNLRTDDIATGGGSPAGIVYHSTESHIAPFAAAENRRLRLAGVSVLDYVHRNRSYHYLIDRFGRVHRVVDERDAAWHAGASIWGSDSEAWLNLNHSFLGVALEATTGGEMSTRDPITPAQSHAVKTLTAMLRARYSIPAENCVTHAQVSINASSQLLGYHTDWASGFPYAAAGLPDNYALPLTAVRTFGFGYDADFLSSGAAAWTGLALTEERVKQDAASAATPVPLYRSLLNKRYRKAMSRLRNKEHAHE
jgi:hypothetical protein